MHRLSVLVVFISAIVFSSCSILKKEDPEKGARDFLVAFEQSLALADEKQILAHFDAAQSKESILSAISVLSNKESQFINCSIAFNNPSFSFTDAGIDVTLPVVFKSQKTDSEYNAETTLNFRLKSKKDLYVITSLDADQFYSTFAKLKNEMQWETQREQALLDRQIFYSQARALQQTFDSVIWYTKYDKKTYFYVISGTWDNYFRRYETKGTETGAKMGVVDERGNAVIPVEYDLIGTLGFNFSGIVEVKKNDKFGYYDFENRQTIVPAEYDLIIPYGKQNILCLVRNGSTYGYYTYTNEYKVGFPSDEIQQWVDEFMFVPKNLQISSATKSLCEIPAKEHAGFGIVMPPSYLVKTGIFEQFIGGITATDFPLEGWTDYVETEGTVSQRVTESLLALVTTIKERYLEGREEFYTHDKLVFVGPGHDTLAVQNLAASGGVAIRKLDNVIEVKYSSPEEYYYEQSFWPDIVPAYSYFAYSEDLKIIPLKSDRAFPQTQFVKLDSSYFTGSFVHSKMEEVNGEQQWSTEEISFLSLPTIKYMRDEILASYGVRIMYADNNNFEMFAEIPEKNREQAEAEMSEIDRYNLQFLETLLTKETGQNI